MRTVPFFECFQTLGKIVLFVMLLSSCKITNEPTTTSKETTPKPTSDVETIDTISIELDLTDSLITPGMPMVARWPLQYEIFDGHFVLFSDSLSNRVAELTLLSLRDWSKILSANSEDAPTQATDTASQYIEYGLAGWMIPSETFARKMKDNLDADDINTLNAHLSSLNLDTMRTKSGSSNARYLCEKATKTFSLAPNTNITTAGAKTQYRLRLIKTQRVAR